MKANVFNAQNDGLVGRQIAFFAAFLLPVYKLLELPSLLAGFVQGDLLLPAILHFLLQGGLIALFLLAISRLDKPLFAFLEEKLGKWAKIFYCLYAVYFIFFAVLPLLDLEKFVYAAFFDTAPTLFVFAFFFFLSAFVCTKGLKATGRSADACLFLFPLPLLALLTMSLGEADFSNLLPFFEQRLGGSMSAFHYTTPHFSDALLLLPLLGNLRYKKGDGLKIVGGYAGGAVATLVFLAVFYGVFSTIAPREHYAFIKIAQYFPALAVIGRVDLLLVYVLCVVLFFYVCTPLQYSVNLLSHTLGADKKIIFSAILNFAAFLFVLFCNRFYDRIYGVISGRLAPVFWVFWLLPLLSFFLPNGNSRRERRPRPLDKAHNEHPSQETKPASPTQKTSSTSHSQETKPASSASSTSPKRSKRNPRFARQKRKKEKDFDV